MTKKQPWKNTRKILILDLKIDASILKNIAKTMEGPSKTDFSHFRHDVEKVTLRPLILERFLPPKSSQEREKVVSKSWQKNIQFSDSFFIDFCSMLGSLGHPKILDFCIFWALDVPLVSSWRQGRPQDEHQGWFLPFRDPFFKDFSYVLKHFAKDLPMHIEHRFYFVSLFCELLIPSGSAPMVPALRASISNGAKRLYS